MLLVSLAARWNGREFIALHTKILDTFACSLRLPQYKGEDGKGADEKFHFMAKSDVNGRKTNEVFSFLKSKLPWTDGTRDVRWNFGKVRGGDD